MHFEPNHIYHVYNRGNNKAPIFFNKENYLFFLQKVRKEWLAYCDIFCYCLMPNHFHFMLQPKMDGCKNIQLRNQATHLQKLSKVIGKTLSSYTQAINIQNETTGNLFQKKTRAKCLTDTSMNQNYYSKQNYLINCFHYIHFNPIEAALTKHLKDWAYSSWSDYYGFRNGTLCNKRLTLEKTGLTELDFIGSKEITFDKKIIELIW